MNPDNKLNPRFSESLDRLVDDLRRESGCLDEVAQADFASGRGWRHPKSWLHARRCRLCRGEVEELHGILHEFAPETLSLPLRKSVAHWMDNHQVMAGFAFVVAVLVLLSPIVALLQSASPHPFRTEDALAAGSASEKDKSGPPDIRIAPNASGEVRTAAPELPQIVVTPTPPAPSLIVKQRPPATPQPEIKSAPVIAMPNSPSPPGLIIARTTPAPVTANRRIALAATPKPNAIVSPGATPQPVPSDTSTLIASSSFWQGTANIPNTPDLEATVEISARGKRVGRAAIRDLQPLFAANRKPLEIAPRESFNMRFGKDVPMKADLVIAVVDFNADDRLYVVKFTRNRQFADIVQFGNGRTVGGRFELVILVPNRAGQLLSTAGTNKEVKLKEQDQIFVKDGRLFQKGPNDKDDAGIEVHFADGAGRTGIAVSCSIQPDGR